jgi:hypothetical protein
VFLFFAWKTQSQWKDVRFVLTEKSLTLKWKITKLESKRFLNFAWMALSSKAHAASGKPRCQWPTLPKKRQEA